MRQFFSPDAVIRWHNTNEQFTAEEFIRANCDYPGRWDGEIGRVGRVDDLVITAVHVYSRDRDLSFHVTSFFRLSGDKIIALDEYWGDDGPPPQWRQDMGIGGKIHG